MHPILVALWRHPEVFAAHAANYILLLRQESAVAARDMVVRAVFGVLAGVMLIAAIVLTGIAILLGFAYEEFVWSLVIVPGICWAVAAIGARVATRSIHTTPFGLMKVQVHADALLFRSVGRSVTQPTRWDV
jgi:hypothetical protein